MTPSNRAALQHLALGLIAWLNAEMVRLFACIQCVIIKAASESMGGFNPALLLIGLVVLFGTIGWHIFINAPSGKVVHAGLAAHRRRNN